MSNKQKIVSVFGSSAPRPGSADYEAARTVGRLLAQAGFAVQTGSYSGIMAGASQGACEAGGHVIGVTCAQIEQYRPMPPNQWVKEQIKHQTLRERLLHLVDHCDGAIVMPGGIGTMEEFFEVLSWAQLALHEKPCGLLNVSGYYDPLIAFLDHAAAEDFIKPEHRALMIVDTSPEGLLERFEEVWAERAPTSFDAAIT